MIFIFFWKFPKIIAFNTGAENRKAAKNQSSRIFGELMRSMATASQRPSANSQLP